MLSPINVGIIGYGLSAKVFHIPFVNLTPSLTLKAIVQRTPTPTNSAPADHPTLTHYTTADALFADPTIHLIILTTPPITHYPLALAAITAGKHLLVEKPFVPTSAEAATLITAAQKANVLLCVYQNRRWDADFQTVQSLISSGKLGRIVEFQTHFDRYRTEKPSGTWKAHNDLSIGNGPVFDLGSHLFDQVYTLFGKPSRIYANHISQRDGKFTLDDADSLSATLAYEATGLTVFVRISVLSAEVQQPRFWVRGSEGSFVKTGLDPQEPQLRAGLKYDDPALGYEDEKWWGQLTTKKGAEFVRETVKPEPKTYRVLFEKLAGAIQSGKWEDLPVPATEAKEVLEIIEAVIKSSKEGVQVTL